MAITANTISVAAIPTAGNDWMVSLYSADISGCEEIKAAETLRTHYIRRLKVFCATTTTITFGSGETAGAVTTIHLGPLPVNASGGPFEIVFGETEGLKCTSGAAFCVDSGGTAPIAIYCEGRTCTD